MILIVVLSPVLDFGGRVLQRFEPVHVQAFIAEPPVEGLDGGIVRRLSASAEVEDHVVRIRPEIHRGTDELGSIVALDPLRQSPIEPEALEGRDDILTGEPAAHRDVETLARELA